MVRAHADKSATVCRMQAVDAASDQVTSDHVLRFFELSAECGADGRPAAELACELVQALGGGKIISGSASSRVVSNLSHVVLQVLISRIS